MENNINFNNDNEENKISSQDTIADATMPWALDGHQIPVADENNHLGMIVCGIDEEDKNVEMKLEKGRKSLFALLGPAFAYKCLLPPTLQCFLWKPYTSPVITSGLCSLPLRPTNILPLTAFHRKILRGFLKLSQSSPIPALYFLLAELPLEAWLHLDMFALFWSIWSNPQSTMFCIAKHLLTMSENNSRTWCIHIRHLCKKYGMTDPLVLMQEKAWSKHAWKSYTTNKVTAFHEKTLREDASTNSKMSFLNVSLTGLNGKPHHIFEGIFSSYEVKKLRIHVKMLCQDYLTYGLLAVKSDSILVSGHCRIFPESGKMSGT